MTKLNSGDSVTRETQSLYRGKPLLITLRAGFLELKIKGSHGPGVTVDYLTVFDLGQKIQARDLLKQKGKDI